MRKGVVSYESIIGFIEIFYWYEQTKKGGYKLCGN